MKKKPLVSVIMPVYNGQPYLKQAINSILQQTFSDFELLILNDGSTDKSQVDIDSFSDKRIKKITHKRNKGLIATLNEGFLLAEGRFIARMDQDDISDPHRFKKQITLLSSTSTAVVGCLPITINTKGSVVGVYPLPLMSDDIALGMYSKNCFCHGSVCIDRYKISKRLIQYPTQYQHAEDYALWLKLADNGVVMRNIPEPLYYWRSHEASISKVANKEQYRSFQRLFKKYQKNRIKITLKDIFKVTVSAIRLVPKTIQVKKRILPTHLQRDYQYILWKYIQHTCSRKPVHAIIAALCIIVISPLNIYIQLCRRT